MSLYEIGDFIVGGELTSGSYSSLCKAYHKRKDRDLQPDMDEPRVVVKILSNSAFNDANLREKFNEEALSLRKLKDHPNIVNIEDFVEDSGKLYIFMDYIPGQNLADFLKYTKQARDIRDIGVAVPFFCKLLDAVDFAHDQGYVHRDIKPENIMVKPNFDPVILDFGIARFATQSQEEIIVGSGQYMSPEQVYDPDLVDHRSDIYSLGVVLYKLLLKNVIFIVKSTQLAKVPIVLGQTLPELGIDSLDRVIQKATSSKIEDRYKTCAAFAEDLRSIDVDQLEKIGVIRNAPVQDPVESPEVDEETSGNKIKAVVPYLIGLVLLVVIGFFIFQGADNKEEIVSEGPVPADSVDRNQEVKPITDNSNSGSRTVDNEPNKLPVDTGNNIDNTSPDPTPAEPTPPKVKTYNSFEGVLTAMLEPDADVNLRTELTNQLETYIADGARIKIVSPKGTQLKICDRQAFVRFAATESRIDKYELKDKVYGDNNLLSSMILVMYKQSP